jgi:hypothetical protein
MQNPYANGTPGDSLSGSHPATHLQRQLSGLHRTLGNQAVLHLLSHPTPALQTKLTINQPGDRYEQEADHVADQVMRMPDPAGATGISPAPPSSSAAASSSHLQRKCACGGSTESGAVCAECEKKELMRSATGPAPVAGPAPPIVHDVIRSPGQPLDQATRAFMEPRFGRDFSGVSVHRDSRAATSARAVSAYAYTIGNHIIFDSGRYAPETISGRRLLAHELAHVVQQSKTASSGRASIQRFSTKEHFDIGNDAYARVAGQFSGPAFRKSDMYQTLQQGSTLPTGSRVKTYGDIVADGDYFETFEDLIRESGKRPGRAGMAALATRNIHHFTPNNIQAWLPQHDLSVSQMKFAHDQLVYVREWLNNIDPILRRARAALDRNNDAEAERLLNEYQRRFNAQGKRMESIAHDAHDLARQALARNAFAEHFLTDAFSAGHVVTPRKEILQEAHVQLADIPSTPKLVRSVLFTTWGELEEVRAQARSLAWHDLDNANGVEVQNSKAHPKTWIACGDGCSGPPAHSHWAATRDAVVEATTESIKDLWRAGLTGVRPPDYKAVTDLVPHPTFKNYPNWNSLDWRNQLGYIRGDNVPHVPGEQLDPFSVVLHPIEHCGQLDPGCYDPFILTNKDWVQQYSFDHWVRPWIARLTATAATRYRF